MTPNALDGFDFGLDDFLFNGDDDRFRFIAPDRGERHHLVIPGDVIDRERHVLLRLELDHLLNLGGIHGRQLDEAHEHALPGDGKHDFPSPDAILLEKLRQGGGDEFRALLFLVGIESQFRHAKTQEGEGSAAAYSEFGDLEGTRTKINRDDFIGGSHE